MRACFCVWCVKCAKYLAFGTFGTPDKNALICDSLDLDEPDSYKEALVSPSLHE